MTHTRRQVFAGAAATMLSSGLATAADPAFRVGAPAPAFACQDSSGTVVSLQDLAGKTVVLEWTNTECPYVGKHYSSGNMQALQAEAAAVGTVWLTVSSARAGQAGFMSDLEAAAWIDQQKARPTHLLLDHSGAMLKAYSVNVALTMAVIRPDGVLAYYGAIDDKPTARIEDVAGAHNYVRAALSAIAADQPVRPAQTRPYGCVPG